MDRYEESMFDDLAADEADDSFDEFDEADSFDEGDDSFDEGDEFDEADEFEDSPLAYEAFDEGDEFDEADDGFDEDAFEDVIASALGAEDTDEFFGKIFKAIKKAAPTIGKIARAVGPVASLIPGVGTAIGGVANVVGELMADEASEDEALDAFAELAVRNKAARPVVAGLAAKKVLGPKAAQMPLAMRKAAVHTINKAAKHLVRTGGPTAIRALPRLARSVKRTAVARHTPPSARARVLASTARKVVQRNPRLRQQLARPSRAGKTVLRRVAGGYGGTGGGYRSRAPRRYGWAGAPGRGNYGGWGGSPAYGPWGGYADYPTAGSGAGYGDGGSGDYRKIRTRGPVTISIRPR
jgi:hypothetical protein